MRVEKVLVTPQMAKQFLANQHNVRLTSRATVDCYSRDMINGAWTLCVQGIVFDAKGRLRDGQHRMQALIKAGVSLPFWASYDCTEDEVSAIDIGRPRSLGHVMYPGEQGTLQRVALQCVRFLAIAETGTNGKFSPAQAHAMIAALGADALEAICTNPSRQLSAAVRSAFVLAYPIDPRLISYLWQHTVDRDPAVPDVPPNVRVTFEVLMPITGPRSSSRATRTRDKIGAPESKVSVFYRTCTGLHACLTSKPLRQIKGFRNGYDALLAMRQKLGLPTNFNGQQRHLFHALGVESEAAQ